MTADDGARSPQPGSHLDTDALRQVLGQFASGLTIVTSTTPEGPVGFTCQAFASLSLDPPQVLLAPGSSSRSWPRIARTGRFCVNVLAEDQEELSRTFARSGVDRFAGVGWRSSGLGSPVLDGTLAWIDCTIAAVYDGDGAHVVAVGAVHDLGARPQARPLLYHRGTYLRPATAAAS